MKWTVLFLFVGNCALLNPARAQIKSLSAPVTIDFCELAKTPTRYASQNVSVRTAVFKGWLADGKSLRAFVLTESSNSANCPGFHVTVTLPTENSSTLC
jgi:hypothetical protein